MPVTTARRWRRISPNGMRASRRSRTSWSPPISMPFRRMPALNAYAVNAGRAVFNTNCVQCHQREGAGLQSQGYPTLSDNAWLYGGTMEAIVTTVTHGVRNTTDPDARNVGMYMPAWSAEAPAGDKRDMATEQLSDQKIGDVVNYVLKISGQTVRRGQGHGRGGDLRQQLRGLPRRRRQGQPRHGCAEPDRCDLAVRRRCRDADEDHRRRARRRDAGLGWAAFAKPISARSPPMCTRWVAASETR